MNSSEYSTFLRPIKVVDLKMSDLRISLVNDFPVSP